MEVLRAWLSRFSVLSTDDCWVNISLVDPTVLVSSTENLLVERGVGFTVDLPEMDLKSLMSEAVVVAMDAWRLPKAKQAKAVREDADRFSGRSTVKPTPRSTNRFSVLETSTVGSTRDMLTQQSSVEEPENRESHALRTSMSTL